MKKLVSMLLALLLLCGLAIPTMADEPVTLDMTLVTNANYNHSDPDRDLTIDHEIENRANVKLNITWVSSEGYAEKVTTMIAENNLPDIFSPGLGVANLAEEGAIMALDPYLDKIDNYMAQLGKDLEVAVRNVSDGQLYQVNALTKNPSAYAMIYRQDWLDNLGIETVPETIDEWLEVWREIRDNDANKNGDPNDEIPFVDPATFTSGKQCFSLLLSFGIKSNGRWYVDEDGTYSLVFSHPKFRDFLELVTMMYSEKLLDQEVFTNNATAVAALFNSNVAFSGYQWTSRPSNTIKTLSPTIPEVDLKPTLPIKGEAQLIPARNVLGSTFVFSYELESKPEKLEAALRLINFMYSDEGIFLTNWGIEGQHHTIVDGQPVLMPELAEPSATKMRYAGLISQQFPTVWIYENYRQMTTGNKPPEEMDFADYESYIGTQIYFDYYFTMPPSLNTPAMVEYSADIMAQIDQLYANCVTGKISIDDFFAGYEALKPNGLQEILDQAQEYYDQLLK